MPITPQDHQGKNIVICCDGTGNKFIDDVTAHGSNSNVVKFYAALEINNYQVGYYHPGVGTAGAPAARNWLARQWSVIKGLAFGAGFKDNVLDAYRYLMSTYNDGDRVYLIGFSRGAYTVRALAGLLDGYGLLCRGNEGHLPYAWNEYVRQHRNRKKQRVSPKTGFRETFSHKRFRIHFMGIWDTVSSVGWISTPLRLYNIAQNPTVRMGRHAISIDERRCFYRDNLWSPATAQQLKEVASDGEQLPSQDLLEVWFTGVHSDVGGSYPQLESGLSNITLQWMLDQAKNAGAHFSPVMRDLVLGRPVSHMESLDLNRKIRTLEPLFLLPRQSRVHGSLRGWWWVLECLPHRYYDKDDSCERWRTPLGMRRRIPEGALIHGSVYQRMNNPACKYNPSNLNGGINALESAEVHGQENGSIYRYVPSSNPKPALNTRYFRSGVMVLTALADLLAIIMLGSAISFLFQFR